MVIGLGCDKASPYRWPLISYGIGLIITVVSLVVWSVVFAVPY